MATVCEHFDEVAVDEKGHGDGLMVWELHGHLAPAFAPAVQNLDLRMAEDDLAQRLEADPDFTGLDRKSVV